ncbi:methylmalonyl Co-A mutase-associated GTPase MeaB [uncultured Dokdonia sp.]|uniref:methylmalonyl Co-A mutase-associated GTPase MeaB n=1 Tax=uncultured Dokdonia sp. TaxID=575653 RepID=UPI00260F3A71|nr:methylmalonyl Co-A mutase-associated GTPase MeaB [uncultured Dokdonia sp.]
MTVKKSDIHRSINPAFTRGNRQKAKPALDIPLLAQNIIAGNHTALSKGITLVESTVATHQDQAQLLIEKCLTQTNESIRIGITGVPGVGKSTFIESFGNYLTGLGKKVAVLAVDPSSSLSHGSILGDKTRMAELSQDKNAFIRPSASGDSLGGVARKTREAIILCEAAGFDTIIIETVGVGQSETMVHSMVDFFLLLKLAGAGDELQGIKRGIIEMADAIVINKADGKNERAAKLAKTAFAKALHLYPPKDSNWTPKVSTCSALEHKGISEIWELILSYKELTQENEYFTTKRHKQNTYWLLQTIENSLKENFYRDATVKEHLPKVLAQLSKNTISPFSAAQELLSLKKK